VKTEKLAGGGVAVLHPQGSLIGDKETDELRKAFEELRKEGNTRAVVDLSKVNYINSTGIGALIAGYNEYSQRGGKIKLCGLSDRLENVFVITKLTAVFDIHPNVKEALAGFALQ
jgi:anti-sigma B factor antagonist